MIVERPEDLPSGTGAPVDVLIVGAGAAGLFLASRLRRLGLRVIVAEQGERIASTAPASWQSVLKGRPHKAVFEGRAIGLGGASTLWGGQLSRFDAHDLDRAYAPWPFGLEELAPHYGAVEQAFGLGPVQSMDAYRQRLGNEKKDPGAPLEVERFFTIWLPEPNFARHFGPTLFADANIEIRLGCTVNGLCVEDDRITGAEILWRGQKSVIAARRTVIAASTLGTLRLLLSCARKQSPPWSGSERLGTAFQDHLAYDIATVEVTDAAKFRNMFENAVVDGIKLQPKLRWSDAARVAGGRGQPPTISAAFVWSSDMEEHLAHLKAVARSFGTAMSLSSLRETPRAVAAVGRNFMPFVIRYVRDRRVMAFWEKGIALQIQAEQFPIAQSRVTLVPDVTQADGLGKLEVHWQVDGREAGEISLFAKAADRYLSAHGLGKLAIDSQVMAAEPTFLEAAVDTNHPAGGAAMGRCTADGLVDCDLSPFGISGCHVLSAAVFPASSQANCTFTLLALANRLAVKLGVELGQ